MAFKLVYTWNKPVAQKVDKHSKPHCHQYCGHQPGLKLSVI